MACGKKWSRLGVMEVEWDTVLLVVVVAFDESEWSFETEQDEVVRTYGRYPITRTPLLLFVARREVLARL